MKIKVLTDSCSDLDKEIREKYDIDYARMSFLIDNKNYFANLDYEEISPKDFYDIQRNGTRIYTTQTSKEEYERIFKKYLDEGYDIIYIGCSSALSSSVLFGKTVAEKILENYPKQRIAVIDSLNSSLGEGSMAIMACEMAKEGKSFDEIVSYIEENKLCVNQFGTVQSLSYLKVAGRIKASKAFFGNLFGVKPIIISDAKGNNVAVKKVKGRRNSLDELVECLKGCSDTLKDQIIYISHADCQEECNYVAEKIKKEISPKGVYVNFIGPIVGASVGPGTIIAYAFGKKVEFVGETK